MDVPAIIATAADKPLEISTVHRREVHADDVRIRIEYCGICHSDIHTVRSEWGPANYPLAAGHEIAGIVEEVGADVTRYSVGDRVGVGCMVGSCGACSSCDDGHEQYCHQGSVLTYNSVDKYGDATQGGYSTEIVVPESFVARIPDGISSQEAAPLLCAGITTYSPLKRFGVGPGTKLAVVGLGGLGHMGVKIAVAMGAEVTVLTRTLSKKADADRLGAVAMHATTEPSTFETLRGKFDVMLNTVSAPMDYAAYLNLLTPRGTMVCVGLPDKPVELNVAPLVIGSRTLAGSLIGGMPETQEMLDFCAEHGIGADVEVISAAEVNDAYERVLASDVRYRFVIDTATLAN